MCVKCRVNGELSHERKDFLAVHILHPAVSDIKLIFSPYY